MSSFDGVTSNHGMSKQTSSILQCGRTCLKDISCKSFFFIDGTQPNCQLVNTIMSDPNINTTITVGASYYVSQSHPEMLGECPPDDNIFRTVTLSDNTQFTFRVMRVNANETEAVEGCINEGAFLAKVLTQAKFDFIRNLLNCTGYDVVQFYRIDGTNHDSTTFDYYSFETVDGSSEYYKNVPAFDGVISMFGTTNRTDSLLQCGHRCLKDTFCESFFYIDGSQQNCQLVSTVMSDPNINTTLAVGSSYYVSHIPPSPSEMFGTCPPDDNIFRTVTLSDNTQFTFRVMRFNANETQAVQGCIDEGAFLAKVLTQAKFDYIRNLLNCTGYDVVPFYRVDGTNHGSMTYDYYSFETVDGDIIPTSFWNDNYYSFPEYNCILMFIDNNWYFLRSPCYHPTYYICEK
ncbi:hypothetical protein ACF0H5_017648 [Mactra antiquata]